MSDRQATLLQAVRIIRAEKPGGPGAPQPMPVLDAYRACKARAQQADEDGIAFDAGMLADVVLDLDAA